jgi:FkbM family methyltransferase
MLEVSKCFVIYIYSLVLAITSIIVLRSLEITKPLSIEETTKLAFDESLGFFTDISDSEWVVMKDISRRRCQQSMFYLPGLSREVEYYQSHWEPNFSCRFEDSLGDTDTDGHKWMCDPHRLRTKNDCLIYSVGSNGQFSFEKALYHLLPNCEIHVFDPGDYSEEMEKANLNSTNYHKWGVKGTKSPRISEFSSCFESKQFFKNEMKENMRALKDITSSLGHNNRQIDVLKIDCEGCELAIIEDIIELNVRQLLIEVHLVCGLTDHFFRALQNASYVIFHKEPNIIYSNGKCIEYSFLKLSRSYFL